MRFKCSTWEWANGEEVGMSFISFTNVMWDAEKYFGTNCLHSK